MKKTFKRQSKTLNSKSKKRTMKAMKGGAWKLAPPVMKHDGYSSGYGKKVGVPFPMKPGVSGPTTKFNSNKQKLEQKLEQKIEYSKKIESDIAFANKELVALKRQVNSYLPREQQQPIFNGIQQKINFIALKEAEASKGKSLAYLEAKLAALQQTQAKQMVNKKPSKAEVLQIIAMMKPRK